MYPLLFSLGPISVNSYGVLVAIGFFLSVILLIRLIEKASLNLQFIADHFFSLVLFSLLGARILYVLFYLEEFSFDWVRVLYFWDGGFVAWGGLISFLLLFYFYAKRNQEDFFKWLDVFIAPAVLWGLFESIGAFLGGRSFGIQTSLPWGVQFDNPEMPFAGIPIHPVQIYSAVFFLILFLWLRSQWNRKTRVKHIGALGLVIYCFFLFFLEFLRGDYIATFLGLRLTQIVSLLVGIFFFRYYVRKRREKNIV